MRLQKWRGALDRPSTISWVSMTDREEDIVHTITDSFDDGDNSNPEQEEEEEATSELQSAQTSKRHHATEEEEQEENASKQTHASRHLQRINSSKRRRQDQNDPEESDATPSEGEEDPDCSSFKRKKQKRSRSPVMSPLKASPRERASEKKAKKKAPPPAGMARRVPNLTKEAKQHFAKVELRRVEEYFETLKAKGQMETIRKLTQYLERKMFRSDVYALSVRVHHSGET